MEPIGLYSPDRSFRGKARRRLARLTHRRPAKLRLDRPMVSFTFDDAPASALTVGRAVLEARGLRGAYYIAADLVGREGPTGLIGTPDDIRAAAAADHEIACHTGSHLDCGVADDAAILADVAANDDAIAHWGLARTTNFAFPFGDISPAAKRLLGQRYDVLRGLHHGVIEDGVDLNQAPAIGVEGPGGEALALHWMRRAARRKGWLIVFTHDVTETPSAWGCTPATLDRLAKAAVEQGFDIVTPAQGARRLGG